MNVNMNVMVWFSHFGESIGTVSFRQKKKKTKNDFLKVKSTDYIRGGVWRQTLTSFSSSEFSITSWRMGWALMSSAREPKRGMQSQSKSMVQASICSTLLTFIWDYCFKCVFILGFFSFWVSVTCLLCFGFSVSFQVIFSACCTLVDFDEVIFTSELLLRPLQRCLFWIIVVWERCRWKLR